MTARDYTLCLTPCGLCGAGAPMVADVTAAMDRLPESIEHFGNPMATRSICSDCVRALVAAAARRVVAVHGRARS